MEIINNNKILIIRMLMINIMIMVTACCGYGDGVCGDDDNDMMMILFLQNIRDRIAYNVEYCILLNLITITKLG